MATKVFTTDLRVGMFVADLDRPWVDTPFLLQGFVIEDDEQIAALRAHCEYVLIDRARSLGAEYQPAPNAPPTNTIPPPGTLTRPAAPAEVKARAAAGVVRPAEPAGPAAKRGAGRPIRIEEISRGGGDAGDGSGMLGRLASGFKGLWGRKGQ